jgi:hypothetical protein
MSDTNCPACGASAWHRAGDGIKNYDCGSSSLSAHQSEFCREREARQKAERERDKYWQAIIMIDEITKWAGDRTNSVQELLAELEKLKGAE